MVICRKLLHSQTSYLETRYNKWHANLTLFMVTTQGQRSQTWRCLRSLNASCFVLFVCFLDDVHSDVQIHTPSHTHTRTYTNWGMLFLRKWCCNDRIYQFVWNLEIEYFIYVSTKKNYKKTIQISKRQTHFSVNIHRYMCWDFI